MTVFIVSAAFILYILIGYPLLLEVWARLRPAPVVNKFVPRTVSVLLPVHNGDRWLEQKLDDIARLSYPSELIETIVISNGSTDRTAVIAREARSPRTRVIELECADKASALNAGLEGAMGEILFLVDVRQRIEPDSLRSLVADFADPRVGVASGELFIAAGDSREEESVGAYWKYEKLIRARQSRINSVPGATGAIYAMRRSLARPLPEGTLLDDVYLPLCAFFQGYRIVWDPRARAFDRGASLQIEFRRKVRTLAGVYQVIGIFPRLLVPNHSLWIHFVSHKLGRMLLPYVLVAAFLSSFWLPRTLAAWALAPQFLLYVAAGVDNIIPDNSLLKRATAPARTFVTLMSAAVCAVSVLFVRPGKLWKQTR
jgi:cellulose synthase/poly-beta-1,6-N-acetylglucosamine synthase-like glycosyltransferase